MPKKTIPAILKAITAEERKATKTTKAKKTKEVKAKLTTSVERQAKIGVGPKLVGRRLSGTKKTLLGN